MRACDACLDDGLWGRAVAATLDQLHIKKPVGYPNETDGFWVKIL